MKLVEVESTQSLLKEKLALHPGLPHGYSILAEIQTAGRGRADHSWVSLRGNLHASILLRNFPFSELTWIPHWVSVCVFKALADLGVDCSLIQLKWPNDLWIKKSLKIGGILCEKKGDVILLGIGLNLAEAPPLGQKTGSVSQISKTLNPEEVLEKILYQLSLDETSLGVRTFYEKHALFHEGDLIEWLQDGENEKRCGSVIGLGAHGELLVQLGRETTSLWVENVRAARLK